MMFDNVRTIGLPEQRMWMQHYHPQFRCLVQKRKGYTLLVCRGHVQPTPINAAYRVRIEYTTRKRPHVFVEEPKLRRRQAEERIPYTFSDDEPCLYFDEFRSDLRLAVTIVPWLCCWLVFYECWRVTGEWQGGGIHVPVAALVSNEEAA